MQTIPGFSDTDRLGLTVFGSALVHMVVVLGVTFTAPKIHMRGVDTLEITLVQTHTDSAPDKPQFLAQANQDGGGQSELAEVARSPLPVMEMSERNNRVPIAQPAPQKPVNNERELLATLTDLSPSSKKIPTTDPRPDKKLLHTQPQAAGLTDLDDLRQERARLSAEISRSWQEYQKLPRHKYLNARTQEYRYAAYMDAWRAKVERIGNLNYPEPAKRQNLAGSLVLDVALKQDGSIHDITVLRSSNHKILDDAAVRIVELAAPFAPLPQDIRAEADILHITRTWRFMDASLTSEN